MTITSPSLQLFRVEDENESIRAVAKTITVAFAHDPLIQWVRPGAPRWKADQADTEKWQHRRVQRAILEGVVLKSASVSHLATLASQPSKNAASSTTISEEGECPEAGAVVLLFPPKKRLKWSLGRVCLWLKLWVLDRLDPAVDRETDEKRLKVLLDTHDAMIEQVGDAWYLEVIAIHPGLQGRGLGGKTMQWVLEYTNHEPILLECTTARNVKFYESFGFRVVREVDLTDQVESVKCWFMLREAGKKNE